MKIRPVGDELFHAYGRTDMTKLIVAFRNFADEPKDKINFEFHERQSMSKMRANSFRSRVNKFLYAL
jgi:hypothetical protein